MIVHRERYFKSWPFQYVKQTDISWRLIGPFDHKGDTAARFPVEDSIEESYMVDGREYRWQDTEARGATIHVNHFFGFEGHLPKSNPGTVYGVTEMDSPREQSVKFWIGFNENSRAGGRRCGPNPGPGEWSIVNSKVWVNGVEIAPPEWKQPGTGAQTPEIPFVDELYMIREPTVIQLKKGKNRILVKAPHGPPAWKWMFTCVPVEWDEGSVSENKN